jgi:hypothetical protein
MNDEILVNLEMKPYKIIFIVVEGPEPSYSERPLIIKEFIQDGTIKIIESKKFSDFNERRKYALNKVKEFELQGLADFKFLISIEEIENKTLKIEEDPLINFILKLGGESYTTHYLPSFKTTAAINLDSNKENIIYEDVRNSFEYLINNHEQINESLKKWFWDEFWYQFEDVIDVYETMRDVNKLEEGLEEYLKLSTLYTEESYYEFKEEVDKFFSILNRIKQNDSWEQKSKILDEVIYLKSIELDKISTEYGDKLYGNIVFNFDYFLEDEHGLRIILKNRENFDLY